MAYKIQYNPEDTARYPQAGRRKPIPWKRLLLLMAVCAAALWLRRNGIPAFLIPGDPEVTTAAANNMVQNLQQGSSVNEAVTVFCKEILHGAGF